MYERVQIPLYTTLERVQVLYRVEQFFHCDLLRLSLNDQRVVMPMAWVALRRCMRRASVLGVAIAVASSCSRAADSKMFVVKCGDFSGCMPRGQFAPVTVGPDVARAAACTIVPGRPATPCRWCDYATPAVCVASPRRGEIRLIECNVTYCRHCNGRDMSRDQCVLRVRWP